MSIHTHMNFYNGKSKQSMNIKAQIDYLKKQDKKSLFSQE